MSVRLCKWGNSIGLRVSTAVLKAAGLKAGDYVHVRLLDNGDIRVRPAGQVVPAEPDSATGANTPAAEPGETVW